MTPRYVVRTILFASGERFPVLLDKRRGEPLFDPTVYSISALRAKNQASNSIAAALRAVMLLCIFLDLRHIDLDQRVRAGKVLTLGEVEDLVRLCRLPMKALYVLDAEVEAPGAAAVRAASAEKFRMKPDAVRTEEIVTSAANRVRYIRDYLKWLVSKHLSKHGLDEQSIVVLGSAGERTTSAFDARIPSYHGRATLGGREGIGQEAVDRLLEVIDPNSPDNPWLGEFARKRNQLIIHLLYELGIRHGELLGLEIHEIKFRDNTVEIWRKADSVRDPRRKQPLTKTLDRILPISERLARMTSDYIIHVRNGKKKGLKHGFLIVAAGSGAPLSSIGLNKMFEVLRAKCPDLPQALSPHVLRHSSNDLFSEYMTQSNISPEEEERLRSQAMGWKPGSGTAKIYTKRHVRERANEVSLEIQNNIGKRLKNGK